MKALLILGLCIVVLVGALGLYGAIYSMRMAARYPAHGTFVDVAGARIHLIDRPGLDPSSMDQPGLAGSGDGVSRTGLGRPALVLIHGATANLRDMEISLVGPLTQGGFRVVALDRPGHGWSSRTAPRGHDPRVQARLIAEALAAHGVTHYVAIGHSWGGAVVAALALAAPRGLAGAVTLGGASHPWPGPPSWYNRVSIVPVLGRLFRQTLVPLAGPFVLPGGIVANFAPNDPVADYSERAGMPLFFRPAQFGANAADSVHLKSAVTQMEPDYQNIGIPMLIITGDEDRTVSHRRHSLALAQAVPGARLLLLEGVGHMPHHARAQDVTRAIAAFVESLAATPGAR